jgi:hypothetical protein
MPRRIVVALVALGLAAGACSEPGGDRGEPAADPPTTAVEFTGRAEITLEAPERCEHFDAGHCLYPWPSDHFTRPDPGTDTGRRLALDRASMPANSSGVRIDPTEWNRNDGFSPGGPIVLVVPGLDLGRTGAAPITDIGASLAADAPIVLVDLDTGERRPFWAELDATTPGTEPALLVRPAVNLTEGHRHAVALRRLRRADGSTIEPSPAFLAYRDRLSTDVPAVEQRRPAMEELFSALEEAGVDRGDLYLAWDFTVASTRSLTGRALAMRDDALGALRAGPPAFAVAAVEDNPDPTGAWVRTVRGTLEVPSYLTGDGGPGTVLANEGQPDGLPSRTGTRSVPFTCVLGREARDGLTVVYGHGLLGSQREGEAVGKAVGGALGASVCAVDWAGMASGDIGAIVAMLGDLSGFRIIPDRLQQSFVDVLVLARAITHPSGFAADPAFLGVDGTRLLGDRLAFVGNSQGGILGGAVSALTDQWSRVFLGVPGMNYATLLQRSIDFEPFAPLLYSSYPEPADRQLLFALIQQLWARAENDGYAAHLTADPLPGASPKQVLIFAAFGDHQVANVATDVLARTVGAAVREPGLAPGRSPDVEPFWGLGRVTLPADPPATYVMWDFGTPPPPTTNTPPTEGEDPHGKGRDEPAVLGMVAAFLRGEPVPDPCPTGRPCASPGT